MSIGTRISIERCRLAYQCGQEWDSLESLPDSDSVRFCLRCQSAVHLVRHDAELARFAAQGKCVAIRRSASRILVGKP